jgi:uncharacterized membrane protein
MEIREQRFVGQPDGSRGLDQSLREQIYNDQIDAADVPHETQDRDLKRPEAGAFDLDRDRLTRGLGWFSIGIGVVGVIAPRAFARFLGTRNHGVLFRIMGIREIASGVGILTKRRPAGWLWARVGGDIIDLIGLRKALQSKSAKPVNIAIATAAVTGVTALDLRCARELTDGREAADRLMKVKKTILINRAPDELYQCWRDFRNLPRFMKNLEAVEVTTDTRSRWTAKGPAGKKFHWNAEIVEDTPRECIAWRSLEGGDVANSGSVRFQGAPGGRGTLVSVEMRYSPPAGSIGATIAKLFGRAPEQEVEEDLRRFKQMMETGEIITTIGQPAGRRSTSWKYDQTVRRAAEASS